MRIVGGSLFTLALLACFPLCAYAANSELTIAGGATLVLGGNVNLHTGGNFNIGSASSAATVACNPAGATTHTRILIDAGGNLSIFVGSVIHGNSLGYSARYGPLSPSDYTSTPNTQTDYAGKNGPTGYASGGGGGHHGAGGAGMNGGAGGLAYGNCSAPATMGVVDQTMIKAIREARVSDERGRRGIKVSDKTSFSRLPVGFYDLIPE